MNITEQQFAALIADAKKREQSEGIEKIELEVTTGNSTFSKYTLDLITVAQNCIIIKDRKNDWLKMIVEPLESVERLEFSVTTKKP